MGQDQPVEIRHSRTQAPSELLELVARRSKDGLDVRIWTFIAKRQWLVSTILPSFSESQIGAVWRVAAASPLANGVMVESNLDSCAFDSCVFDACFRLERC